MTGELDIRRELQRVESYGVKAGGHFVAEFVRFANDSRQCWRREFRPDHFTASGLVVNADGSRVLLGLHAKVGRWLQFGGHIEPGDTSLVAAARREAHEESGLADLQLLDHHPAALDAHEAPCAPDVLRHLDVQFVFCSDERAPFAVSDESLELAWFDVGQLPPDTDVSVRRLVQAAKSVVGQASSPCD